MPDLTSLTARMRSLTWVAGTFGWGLRPHRQLVLPGFTSTRLARGLALRGTIWPGGETTPYDGVVVVDADGRVGWLGPAGQLHLPTDLPILGGPGCWVGPGVTDAHVHLAFGAAEDALTGGVVAVRDLGAPPADALRWRTGNRRPPVGRPHVSVAGPVITAPGGYQSRSWGAEGFAALAGTPAAARGLVRNLAADGVDLIKIALEAGRDGRWPVPPPAVVRTVVEAAHEAGLPVTAHALTCETVARALDAGVDELCHTPVERLPNALVERVASAGTPVVSTLQTFFSAGQGRAAGANATALTRAGVPLVYGTDLGNSGTRAGVDPRELDRIADAGLGRLGALRAATERSAQLVGARGRTGLLVRGQPAALVLLSSDPLVEPGVWRRPLAVVCDRWLLEPDMPLPDTLRVESPGGASDYLRGR